MPVGKFSAAFAAPRMSIVGTTAMKYGLLSRTARAAAVNSRIGPIHLGAEMV
uniref:Uncharacterized protein n=1 Tax=Rhizobium meliloti TaxID=382 RepID=I2E2A3_RHIML|nr:short hypothetical protein [Sinorhizobium meliloti]